MLKFQLISRFITYNYRLPIFIYKPAPIQASWLAQGSTGISEIDYFIGSHHITPKNEEKHFVEKRKHKEDKEGKFQLLLDDIDLLIALKKIEEGTNILLDRGWAPDKVLSDALVEGMRIVGIDC